MLLSTQPVAFEDAFAISNTMMFSILACFQAVFIGGAEEERNLLPGHDAGGDFSKILLISPS
jgi:hypothetical protein